jgi:hypothetical protein
VQRGDGAEEEREGGSRSHALVAQGQWFVLARDAPDLSSREAIEHHLGDLVVDWISVRRAAGAEPNGECRHVQQYVGRRPSMEFCQEHSRCAAQRGISLMQQAHLVAGQDAPDQLDRTGVSFGCRGPPLAGGFINPGTRSAKLERLLERP